MKLILILISAFSFTAAHAVEIDSNKLDVPQDVVAAAQAAITAHCTDLDSTDLELLSVSAESVKYDQGVVDTTYVLDIEIPNKTNDNDEDMISVTVVDAAISNPAIKNPTVTKIETFGSVTCK